MIEKKHHSIIRQSIVQQLTYDPEVRTRNRKPLVRETELDADWELRCGQNNCFRIFYAVDKERYEVRVTAIGMKEGNRLFIGGEEIKI